MANTEPSTHFKKSSKSTARSSRRDANMTPRMEHSLCRRRSVRRQGQRKPCLATPRAYAFETMVRRSNQPFMAEEVRW
jgi:hypothetical protein